LEINKRRKIIIPKIIIRKSRGGKYLLLRSNKDIKRREITTWK
jgi:hypothetical protein